MRGGCLYSPGGVRYDALIIPGNREMLSSTLSSVLGLAKKGAAVVFESDVPLNVPNLIAKSKAGEMEAMMTEVGLKPKGDMVYAKYGDGHVVVSSDIIVALMSMRLKHNK